MTYESREDKLARWDRELGEARAALTLGESIVMALRDGRATSGASQRDRAEATGLSKSTVARLESDPGRLKLDDVVTALTGTRFHLRLCHDQDGSPVDPQDWLATELLPRGRSGRRLPAHVTAHRAQTTPTWFTARYGYDLPSPEWTWYRPGRSGWQISTSVASDLSLGSGQADTDRAAPRPPEDPCAH